MKAIILAAGQGKRLRPLTEHYPKVMLPLYGKTILDRQIERFHACGIQDITVVTGYKPENVHTIHSGVRFCHNTKYETTNMVGSLMAAKEYFDDDIIVSYGDILYSTDVLAKLISSMADFSVVVDMEWEKLYKGRFDNPYDDAESLVLNGKMITEIGKQRPHPERVQAQYIGLIKFSRTGLTFVRELLDRQQSIGRMGWSDSFEMAYMTDLLQQIIIEGQNLQAVKIRSGWFEIDSIKDYELALTLLDKLK
jgi:L-glutamine-phosphate cytidylyltransferase